MRIYAHIFVLTIRCFIAQVNNKSPRTLARQALSEALDGEIELEAKKQMLIAAKEKTARLASAKV